MSKVRAFKAVRPLPELAAEMASVPYDVVNTTEAQALAKDCPLSFLHVSRAEIDLPTGTDPYSPKVYQRARETFEAWKRDGQLIWDDPEALYVWKMARGSHAQVGVAGAFSVAEYRSGAIARHELTRKDKEDDRTRHLETLRAQTGPVLLTYRDEPQIEQAITWVVSQPPLYNFEAQDGVMHSLWRVPANSPEAARLMAGFENVSRLYIADGHHRAASASRSCKGIDGPLYAVAFASSQLKILPYNRVLSNSVELDETQVLEKLAVNFRIAPTSHPVPPKGAFALYIGAGSNGRWFALAPTAPPLGGASILSGLDVSVMQNLILEPVFGILDPRTDWRIDFVGGIHGTQALEERVRTGHALCAFSLHATLIEELMAVSDSGAIMPPKSTWFEPKLRDGLLSLGF